jgi:hypothetical protein
MGDHDSGETNDPSGQDRVAVSGLSPASEDRTV